MTRWLALIVVAGCTGRPDTRVVYQDRRTGFAVRFGESTDDASRHQGRVSGSKGEPGEVHPAVLEYILASPEGPLAAYYDLALQLASPPARVRSDLDALAADAARLASGRPSGQHYARALARRLAREINRALTTGRLDRPRAYPFVGTAALWWGAPADLERNVLRPAHDREVFESTLRTVIVRHATHGLVVLRSSGTDRVYMWDVSAIAGAFDPRATLDHDTVAGRIIALHPYTSPPRSAP